MSVGVLFRAFYSLFGFHVRFVVNNFEALDVGLRNSSRQFNETGCGITLESVHIEELGKVKA